MRRQFKGWGVAIFVFSAVMQGGWADQTTPCKREIAQATSTYHYINRTWPIRPRSDPIVSYIQHMGDSLLARTRVGRQTKIHFSVIRDRSVNAYAIGGFQFFITDGAIAFARNESELVAIIAHELGHQLARHFCTGSSSDERDVRSSQMGLLTQIIDPEKEQEADRIALKLLRKGGYDPFSILDVTIRLLDVNHSPHTQYPNKLTNLESLLKSEHKIQRKDSDEFVEVKNLLITEWDSSEKASTH